MKKRIKVLSLLLVLVLSLSLMVACGGSDDQDDKKGPKQTEDTANKGDDKEETTEPTEEDLPPMKLRIMRPGGATEAEDNDPKVIEFYEKIEEYTNTEIVWEAFESDPYYEQLTLVFAGGDVPSILVTGNSPDFINAVENDAFWDITDYIDEFHNLKTIPETVRLNASINGRMFGVPRSRDLGRNGFGYRLDWLNNLGLKEPTTIEELYDMLVGFTYDDPDGNGQDDTYGLGVTEYAGTWDIMQVWFGAPNGWGLDDNGELIPAHLTQGYDDALNWFRQIYSEGLVNPDFDTVGGGDWDSVLLRSGVAGASADVVDRFRRNQEHFENEGIPAEHMIIGYVDAGHGPRVLPTNGYADVIAFSKAALPTEDDLMRALGFINAMGDAEMQNLMDFGLEDFNYYVEDGWITDYTDEEREEKGTFGVNKGLNQILPYFNSPEEAEKVMTREPSDSVIRTMEADVKADNENYVVPNYGAGYTSDKYVELGQTLDPIIAEARVEFIKGEIDEVGLQEAKDQWLRSGGQDVIDEMNELYKASGN